MINKMLRAAVLAALTASAAVAQEKVDSSPHTAQFIAVEPGVKLEVLDWGGSGRPLVFLAGLGETAHEFDQLALKFTTKCHVYGITRRGFGLSSQPTPTKDNYSADRLGDDVLAVMAALKLDHPVLVGHSLAGEELSSIGSRFPNRVAGLIYLEAANGYAYYDRVHGDLILDTLDLKKRLDALEAGTAENRQFMGELLASVSQLEKDLEQSAKQMAALPDPPAPPGPPPAFIMAIIMGTRKYTEIHVPILAIFACPHNLGSAFPDNYAAKAALQANDLAECSAQADALQSGIPTAIVVRLKNADHYIFKSNEVDVLAAMNAFLAKLP